MPSFYKAFFGLILLPCNLLFAQGKVIMKGGTMTIVNSTYLVTTDVFLTAASTINVKNSTIKIAGSITNNGIFDVTDGTVEMNGSSLQTIPANAFITNKIKNLIVSNDIVLAGEDSLTGVLSFGSVDAKTFSTGGFLTLKSSAAGTANVADITNEGENTGNQVVGDVKVERYVFANKKAWWLLSIPTNTGQTAKQAWQEGATNINDNPVAGYGIQLTGAGGVAKGFDAATSTPSMKKYKSSNNTWVGIANTNVDSILAKEGYMTFVRGDRTAAAFNSVATPTVLRTTGNLFTGDQPGITVAANKFASIGNPYAALLNMRDISKTGIKDFFYLWDPKLGGTNGLGGYQTLSINAGGDYELMPGGGSHGAFGDVCDSILSGQAFLVQAGNTDGTITFGEAAKDHGSGPVSRASRLPRPQFRTALYGVNTDSSTYIIDGVLNNYDDSYSNGVDNMDAFKSANTSENLSIKTANTLLAIERRQLIAKNDTIFLDLANTKVQQYRFQFTAIQLDKSVLSGFLEDAYLHTRTSLSLTGNTLVNFNIVNIPGSYAINRFRIVFAPALVLPVTFTYVKAHQENTAIAIEWKVENEINIKKYGIEKSNNGTQFTSLSYITATGNGGHPVSYQATDAQPVQGYNYYRIKSVDGNGTIAFTNIVKVLMGKGKQEIIIYPNPVIDGVISIQLNNMPEGKYAVKLLNNLGQKILDKTIQHAGGSSTELITMHRMMPHGVYQLEITQPNHEMITNKLIH